MKAASQTSASARQSLTISTAGEAFGDGTLLELIREDPGSTELSLLRYQPGKKPVIASVHSLLTGTYVPADLSASLLRYMHLPARSTSYRSTGDLFGQIVALLSTTCGCEPQDAQLAAYFVVATHFVDCLDVAPCLGVAADPAEGANFLRGLTSLCRHPLPLADLKSADMRNLPHGLHPTLLMTQPTLSSAAIKALQASQHRGFGVLKGDDVVDTRCAKVFLINDATPEELLCLCSTQIYLRSTQRPTTVLDDSLIRERADLLQPQLLRYRLENHAAVQQSSFDVPEFAGATRLAARSFGACIVNDSELQAAVVALLKVQDESARGARWMKLDSLVVEALLVLCHENKEMVRVGEVATWVNGILEGRGESIKIGARKVGSVLRQLNLFSERDNRGYRFLLVKDACRAIHRLGRDLEVPTLKEGVVGCAFCAEIVPHEVRP